MIFWSEKVQILLYSKLLFYINENLEEILTGKICWLLIDVTLCEFMGVLKQIAEYLYIKKPDPKRPKSLFVKYMHGINRISLLIFILCLIILAIKLLR